VWGDGEITARQLETFGCINLLNFQNKPTGTGNGITSKADGGVWTVSGTASSTWFFTLAGGTASIPDGWNVGDRLWISCPTYNSLALRILGYPGGRVLFTTNESGYFTVPDGYDGLQLRFQIATGKTVPETVVRPFVSKNPPPYMHRGFDKPPAMLTIIDDDGNSQFYTQLLPLVESRGISISSAVVVKRPEDPETYTASMTWEQIEDAHKRGAEILNHTYSHLTSDLTASMTAQEIWLDYQKASNILAAHGIQTHDILVFAGASGSDANVQQAARWSCRMAFHAGGNEMAFRDGFDIYDAPRYRLYSDYGGYDLNQIKGLVDDCVANGGWMIWMIHTSEANWTSAVLQTLTDAIDYAIEQGLPIVSAETGYRFYAES
jgi:peptidoglycan/xylan/chitin deacetylase (PgdA/CDA1 family)